MKTATANTHTSTGRGSSESTSHSEQSEAGGGEKGSKSSVPIGAIVGGVVGGITVLGLIALGFFYVARKGRKQETETVGMGGGGYEEEVKSTEQGGLESWNGSEQTQMGRYQQAGYHFHGSEIDGQGVYSQRMEGAFQEMDGAGRR